VASNLACPLLRGLLVVFGWSNGRSKMTTAPVPRKSARIERPLRLSHFSPGRAIAPLRPQNHTPRADGKQKFLIVATLASSLKQWKALTDMHRLITCERDEDHLQLLLPPRRLASMRDVNGIGVMHDCFGTADGLCLRCGAYLSITIPSDESAMDALSKLFDKHLTEGHRDLEEVDAVTQAIAANNQCQPAGESVVQKSAKSLGTRAPASLE
jgi:hypothetical protein